MEYETQEESETHEVEDMRTCWSCNNIHKACVGEIIPGGDRGAVR